ncbi:hypothetical protein [Mesorhizobium sp. M0488]|uniref:hypothetical protein n=1 Tax=unclassified Mesorhizobium TaxID=325217 RepID=UPI003337B47B
MTGGFDYLVKARIVDVATFQNSCSSSFCRFLVSGKRIVSRRSMMSSRTCCCRFDACGSFCRSDKRPPT